MVLAAVLFLLRSGVSQMNTNRVRAILQSALFFLKIFGATQVLLVSAGVLLHLAFGDVEFVWPLIFAPVFSFWPHGIRRKIGSGEVLGPHLQLLAIPICFWLTIWLAFSVLAERLSFRQKAVASALCVICGMVILNLGLSLAGFHAHVEGP
jgi:hypothetical protein